LYAYHSFKLGLLICPEDGGCRFPWNVSKYLPYDMMSHCRRQWSLLTWIVCKECRIWGSHSSGYEECYFLGHNIVQLVDFQETMQYYILQDRTLQFAMKFWIICVLIIHAISSFH
jgi:hypothetical protein